MRTLTYHKIIIILRRSVLIAMNSGFDKTYDVCVVMA